MLLATGNPPEALAAFGHALALSPRSALAFNNRGVALAALGQTGCGARGFLNGAFASHDPCFAEAAGNLEAL